MTNLLLAWLQYGVIGVSWTLLGAIGVYAYLCKMLNEDYRKIFNEWLEESNSEFWSSASTKQKICTILLTFFVTWPVKTAMNFGYMVQKIDELYREETTIKES